MSSNKSISGYIPQICETEILISCNFHFNKKNHSFLTFSSILNLWRKRIFWLGDCSDRSRTGSVKTVLAIPGTDRLQILLFGASGNTFEHSRNSKCYRCRKNYTQLIRTKLTNSANKEGLSVQIV